MGCRTSAPAEAEQTEPPLPGNRFIATTSAAPSQRDPFALSAETRKSLNTWLAQPQVQRAAPSSPSSSSLSNHLTPIQLHKRRMDEQRDYLPSLLIAHDPTVTNTELGVRRLTSVVRCLAPEHVWERGTPRLIDPKGRQRNDTTQGVTLVIRGTANGKAVRVVFRDMQYITLSNTQVNKIVTRCMNQIQVYTHTDDDDDDDANDNDEMSAFQVPLCQHTTPGIESGIGNTFPTLRFAQRRQALGTFDTLRLAFSTGFLFADIERIIRTHANLAPGPLFSVESLAAPANQPNSAISATNACCCICLDAVPTILVMPCRHLCLCQACSTQLAAPAQCPQCREPIAERIAVFVS